MTRLDYTGWAGALLGLAFTGTALAQTAPDDTTARPTDDTTMRPGDTTTDTTTTTPSQTPTTNTDIDVNVSDDPGRQNTPPNTDATAPADVDVNVRTPDTVMTGSTDYVVPPTTPVTYEDDDGGYRPFSGLGIAIAAGGGAGGFTNDEMRGTTDIGGDWDVRLTLGTRSPLAFEGSYIGSAQGIDALGLDNNALLVGNGVQGALRLNATIDFPIQPFIFGGVGWRRYDLSNADENLSDVSGSDDVVEIPLGVGIAGKWQGLILDARGEFRATTNENLLPERGVGDTGFAEMHRWGVKGTVGMEF